MVNLNQTMNTYIADVFPGPLHTKLMNGQSINTVSYTDNKSLGAVSCFSGSMMSLRLRVCAPIPVKPPPSTLHIISI